MSHYTQLLIPHRDQWSAEQIFVAYDLCRMISHALMERYED